MRSTVYHSCTVSNKVVTWPNDVISSTSSSIECLVCRRAGWWQVRGHQRERSSLRHSTTTHEHSVPRRLSWPHRRNEQRRIVSHKSRFHTPLAASPFERRPFSVWTTDLPTCMARRRRQRACSRQGRLQLIITPLNLDKFREVGWLVDYVRFQHKNRLYQGQGLGWRLSSAMQVKDG